VVCAHADEASSNAVQARTDRIDRNMRALLRLTA
jgi:phage-related minor tail protein